MSELTPKTPAAFGAEAEPSGSPNTYRFRFTGTAGEYFRIWIVNTLLNVLTLGVYSAWAKVRTKQYFYRHTWLDDASFEYLANPLAILKGRIVMGAVLGAIALSQHYALGLYFALILGFLLATPWLVTKALSFNARNSAYRNVRFSFRGATADAYLAYLIGGAAYLFTCGLGVPYLQWRISQFAVDGHRYGDKPFRFRTDWFDYAMAFVLALAISLPVIGAYMAGSVGMAFFTMGGDPGAPPSGMPAGFMVLMVAFYALLIIPGAYLKTRIANLFWGGIDIDDQPLESTQQFKEVLFLQVTNILAVIFTLGLAVPWAKVRSYRYRIEHLAIHTTGSLVAQADHQASRVGAFGDAAGDLGDLDLDFGG